MNYQEAKTYHHQVHLLQRDLGKKDEIIKSLNQEIELLKKRIVDVVDENDKKINRVIGFCENELKIKGFDRIEINRDKALGYDSIFNDISIPLPQVRVKTPFDDILDRDEKK